MSEVGYDGFLHEYKSYKDACSCGWIACHTSVEHPESQWASHLSAVREVRHNHNLSSRSVDRLRDAINNLCLGSTCFWPGAKRYIDEVVKSLIELNILEG